MSYSLFDDKGYVADIATAGGWGDFTSEANGAGTALDSFITEGWSEDLEALAADLEQVETASADTADVLRGLKDAVAKATGSVTLSDGVGGTPDEKEPVQHSGESEEDESAPMHTRLALIEAEAVVADTLKRFGRMEANAALRAAKFPKTFLATLDEFYAGHTPKLREALEHPVKAVCLLWDGTAGLLADAELDDTVSEHVAGKREALLTAAECSAKDLPERVAEVVKEW